MLQVLSVMKGVLRMKQIILITDGCSNEGISPVVAAAHAQQEGIVVNVIGIVDDEGSITAEHGAGEIAEIARAGGGMHRLVTPRDLSRTMQMMTRKTVTHTIQQVVQKELKHILGDESIDQLPPERRAEVVEVIDDLGETSALKVALLVDTSASMKPKLRAVEDAIKDLLLSLQARSGKSEISVFRFPGSSTRKHELEKKLDWTQNLDKIGHLFNKLNMRGTTPTGPALLRLVEFVSGKTQHEDKELAIKDKEGLNHKDGMLGDYVI